MALLNGMYIFVEKEDVSHNVSSFTHPVEEGIETTDHVTAEAQEISLTGKIVNDDALSASVKISTIKQWQKAGTLCSYIGRNYANNYQIISFNTSHPHTVAGGCDYDMTLREVRIAKSPYKVDKNTAASKKTATKTTTKTGMQQRQANSTVKGCYHTVKRGETAYSIAQKYSSKGATMQTIMDNNKNAPRVAGDWTTLQVGTKIFVAYR